jgi:hypothetical protein
VSPVRARPGPESGFLLIGVIMFVLALTILGMSLYSLSSYEADFQGRSHDSNAAFYRAQGGLEMVTQLLQASWKLDSAQVAVGHQGVDSVYVSQKKAGGGFLTTGPMNDSVVTVIVLAHSGGSSRKLVAAYQPGHNESHYTRLFTVAGTIDVNLDQRLRIRNASQTWTNDASTAASEALWANKLDWPLPHLMHTPGGVPPPDIAGYLSSHDTLSMHQPDYTPGGSGGLAAHMRFDQHTGAGSQGGVDYYFYTTLTPHPDFSFFESPLPSTHRLQLEVEGTAVWVLPHGLYSDGPITVQRVSPGPTPTLIIVGSPKPNRSLAWSWYDGYGIYSKGGLDISPTGSDVNVILVSDGAVGFLQSNVNTTEFKANSLSVYSSYVQVQGPADPYKSELGYDPAMTLVIASLEASGALPRGLGALPTGFAFVRGSWRDLTP